MRSRIHLELQNSKQNLFTLVADQSPADAAQKANPYTSAHDGICGTVGHETEDTSFEATFDERFERNSDGSWKFAFRVPHTVVMRGHVQCSCCGPTCFQCGSGGFVQKPTSTKTGHGPGAEYCEAVLDLSVLQPLAREAASRVGDKSYGATLQSAAQSLGIAAADIQAHVPYFTSPSAVADVFAATTMKPSDIFYTAAFLQLLLHSERGWIKSAHTKLSKDWPQRPGKKPTSVEVTQ
ncbi:MAG TPA: hypothetical protein VGR55_00460 [Candidatus Acidoferrum sp.]|nr:hypothetical protein [Candidatus Acidoferrum sp.]